MKLIIIILLSICMCGCVNNYVPNDEIQEQEREKNLQLKQEIKDLLLNTSLANYDFEYTIALDEKKV